MRIYETKKVIEWGIKKDSPNGPEYTQQIKAPKDHEINCVRWGPLDKTIYYCTDRGRLIHRDIEEDCIIQARDVHRNEIFKVNITHDFTMLYTCSRDGTCLLLHPETFDIIRSF